MRDFSNGSFVCKDYAARRFIVIEPVEPHSPKVPHGAISALSTKPHLFFCTLMQNARGKQVELLLNAESESDRERWLSAMRPPTVGSFNCTVSLVKSKSSFEIKEITGYCIW